MRLIFINGREMQLSWHEMRAVFWHPLFVSLVMAISVIIILLRPYNDLVRLGAMKQTVFYVSGVVSFMIILVSLVYITQRMGFVVRVPLVLFPTVVAASVWGLWVGVMLGADVPAPMDYVLVSAFNFSFALLGEIVLVSFMVDRIARDLGLGRPQPLSVPLPDEAAQDPVSAPVVAQETGADLPASVTVLGRRFLAHDLWSIKADAHYVTVRLTSGKPQMMRGSMTDAIEDLPDTLGIRVHRSHWVSRQAVEGLQRSSQGWSMALHCGATVPVARGRQGDVADWVKTALPQGARGKPKAPQGVPLMS